MYIIYINKYILYYMIYISALASAPSRPPNPTLTPQNQASYNKKTRSKVRKTQKTGCAYSEHYCKCTIFRGY